MKNPLPLFLFFFFLLTNAIAQKKESVDENVAFEKYANVSHKGFLSSKHFYVVAWRQDEQPRFPVVRRVSEKLCIAEIDNRSLYDSLRKGANVALANDTWKLSPALETQEKKRRNKSQDFILTSLDLEAMLKILQKNFREVKIHSIDRPSNSVIIRSRWDYVHGELLPLNEVIFVDIVAEAKTDASIIGYNRSFHGINAVDHLLPGANGTGIVTGVKEQKMDENDIDLWRRVLPSPLAAPTKSYHATVIASIIGGAGNSSYQGRGIARGSTFFPSSFSNLFADEEAVLRANKVTIQNHSYGTVIQQYYGAEALSYDQLTWNNQTFVPVFSAGNQGESAATDGQYANIPGFANLTGNFKMAKNIITVGAIDNKGVIPAQSSSGPLYDGRLAPHLIALGPNGTSDAAAVVTGTIAVMQQVYADSNSGLVPSASLIKAIMFNTAEDSYQPGIDYKTGYGQLDSYAAVRAIMQKKYDGGTLSAGQEWSKTIDLPTGIHSLKVTLAWTDSAASVNNNKAIINDLDLEITNVVSGVVFKPWVLSSSPHKDSLLKLPVRQRDSLNTAEQVSILLPAPGSYQIKVKGNGIINQPLPFSISYKTDTLNTFFFTSPLQASDLGRDAFEAVPVRWKTFLADSSQSGDLFISYDNGASWQLLAASLKLTSGQYQWQGEDTTSIAMLKMQTSFGQFFSNSFIISKPTRVNLDFNCTDSFRLSWDQHRYATAYRIYALTDNPYLQPVLTVTDTFAVMQKTTYSQNVFAVEPLLNNGLPAARSAAIDLGLQGVQCFYRTIYYTLLDNNRININLEVSTTAYVDSIYFENVSSGGQLIKTLGRVKAVDGNLQYSSVMNDVPAGITYIRGRIKLKNGNNVFTEIVPVLTSGTKSIWFYPNPARKTDPIKYVIKQGVPASSPLQLFDANGRLLRNYPELPSQIDASALPSGLIIYKLLNSENKVLEAGKLILQ